MIRISNHIIKETVLDFRYNGNTDGFAFQNEVKEWFEDFSFSLDEMLTSEGFSGEVVSIDRLEIEVKSDANNWKQQVAGEALKQLKDKLRLMNAGSVAEKIVVKKQQEQFKDLFLFYLEHGYLSWQQSSLSSAEWNEQLQELLLLGGYEYAKRLQKLISSSATAAQRFFQVVSFQSAVHLFSFIKRTHTDLQIQLMHDLQLLMKYATVNHLYKLKQMIYSVYLHELIHEGKLQQMKPQVLALLKKKSAANLQLHLPETIQAFSFQSPFFLEIQKEFQEIAYTKLKPGRKAGATVDTQKEEIKEPAHQTIHDEIYISNAGLVLIAAFLPALFEKTGLYNQNAITDYDKAVCLIHFLATGTEKMNEYELPLAKILCGVPIKQAIHTESFHLNQSMRKEVDEVLISVIEYWNILQNISVAGLRESFLKRNGKLCLKGSDWLLQVEQQSYDMLIQHLPWNFTMIKLPWMNEMLKTEWVY